jgi:mono/diheme cytochrome c family protein
VPASIATDGILSRAARSCSAKLPRVLLALSGGQKLGIALAAAAFILFALASSFLMPRRDPAFPGRRLPLFVVVSILFFAGMMTAMAVFAKEEEEEGHEAEPATMTETGRAARGDAQAGKAVFASAGCGDCHTLEAAGSRGTAGPGLDEMKASLDAVAEQVENGGGGMPAFDDRLTDKQIEDVAAFVVESAGG